TSAFSLEISNNGEYVIGDYGLFCTDTNGVVLWSKTYLVPFYDNDLRHCKQTTDGGYVIAGYIQNSMTVGNGNMYLIKTDSIGNSGCFDFNLPLTGVHSNFFSINASSQVSSGG